MRRRPVRLITAAALAVALTIAGCSSSKSPATPQESVTKLAQKAGSDQLQGAEFSVSNGQVTATSVTYIKDGWTQQLSANQSDPYTRQVLLPYGDVSPSSFPGDEASQAAKGLTCTRGPITVRVLITPSKKTWSQASCDKTTLRQRLDGKTLPDLGNLADPKNLQVALDEGETALGTTGFHAVTIDLANQTPNVSFIPDYATAQCQPLLSRFTRVTNASDAGLDLTDYACSSGALYGQTFSLKGVPAAQIINAAKVAAYTGKIRARKISIEPREKGALVIVEGTNASGKIEQATESLSGK